MPNFSGARSAGDDFAAGDAAESANRVPQLPQKRIPGGLSKPQWVQRMAMLEYYYLWGFHDLTLL